MPTSPQVGIYFNIMSNRRLFVEKRDRFNVEAESLLAELNENLSLQMDGLRLINVYDLFGFSDELVEKCRYSVFGETVTDIAERNMPFKNYYVIDNRTTATEAKCLVQSASCIFLMGGHATKQMQLMHEKGIYDEIRRSDAVILGVSAGSMNMGKHTVDIYESLTPYEGLGFADITIKAHYPPEDSLLQKLKQLSMTLPVCAMTDESAIFINKENIIQIGQIYQIIKGEIIPLTQEQLERMKI